MTDNLKSEHEALLQFLYMAPVGLVQLNIEGEIAMINPLSAQMLMPISPDGELSNLFVTLENVAPELKNLCSSFTKKRGQICDSLRIQLTAGIPGKEDPKVLSISLVKLDQDRIMAVISDVSLAVKRDRQLQQNEAWFNAIFSGVTEYAILSLDNEGKIENWNVSLERLCKYNASDVQDKPYSILFPSDSTNDDRIKDRLSEADENGWSLLEGWCIKNDGSKFWGSSIISPLEGALRQPSYPSRYSLIIRDITEKRKSTEDLMSASFTDHLTGISNRRAFFDAATIEFERWKRKPRPLSVLAIDADHFKKVNDTYGHAAGDEVLKHLSKVLQGNVRGMDLVARMGGEEFSALLPSIDMDSALKIAERIRKAVAESVLTIDGQEIRYTVSIGISSADENFTGIDMLLKIADEALYLSKHNGRNRVSTMSSS